MWSLEPIQWRLRRKQIWRRRVVWVGIWIVFERHVKEQELSCCFPS